MSKLREIADKLGLPIEKEFKLDDENVNGSLIFKISENGNLKFFHHIKKYWVLSTWTLQDVYVKGYTLINIVKVDNKDEEYYKKVHDMLSDYLGEVNENLLSSKDIVTIMLFKEFKVLVEKLIKETEERLLNK